MRNEYKNTLDLKRPFINRQSSVNNQLAKIHQVMIPSVLAPGRTADVGQGQCQEKIFIVGRSVGWRGVRWRRALLDGGRRTDGSFYFFLEPPLIHKS